MSIKFIPNCAVDYHFPLTLLDSEHDTTFVEKNITTTFVNENTLAFLDKHSLAQCSAVNRRWYARAMQVELLRLQCLLYRPLTRIVEDSPWHRIKQRWKDVKKGVVRLVPIDPYFRGHNARKDALATIIQIDESGQKQSLLVQRSGQFYLQEVLEASPVKNLLITVYGNLYFYQITNNIVKIYDLESDTSTYINIRHYLIDCEMVEELSNAFFDDNYPKLKEVFPICETEFLIFAELNGKLHVLHFIIDLDRACAIKLLRDMRVQLRSVYKAPSIGNPDDLPQAEGECVPYKYEQIGNWVVSAFDYTSANSKCYGLAVADLRTAKVKFTLRQADREKFQIKANSTHLFVSTPTQLSCYTINDQGKLEETWKNVHAQTHDKVVLNDHWILIRTDSKIDILDAKTGKPHCVCNGSASATLSGNLLITEPHPRTIVEGVGMPRHQMGEMVPKPLEHTRVWHIPTGAKLNFPHMRPESEFSYYVCLPNIRESFYERLLPLGNSFIYRENSSTYALTPTNGVVMASKRVQKITDVKAKQLFQQSMLIDRYTQSKYDEADANSTKVLRDQIGNRLIIKTLNPSRREDVQNKKTDSEMQETVEREFIESDSILFDYYRLFSQRFHAFWLASKIITADLVETSKKAPKDLLAVSIEKGAKSVSFVPGAEFALTLFSEAIKFWSETEKKVAAARLARLFPHIEKADDQMARLSRLMTLTQAIALKALLAEPQNILDKGKNVAQNPIHAFVEPHVDYRVIRKAVNDCEMILNVLKSVELKDGNGKPLLNPTIDDLLKILTK